jgi:glucosamine--fructose-6-phosphate aminotransferase (isomerizing)
MSLRDEILEQPEVVGRLLATGRPRVEAIAATLRRHPPSHVLIAARGSSDNAALYAKYLWGAANRLTVALAAPSLFSLYGRPPRLCGALVVAVSQSGQSPDIVSVVRAARRQRAPTLAITNAPDSPLARAAGECLALDAGPERSVAATKTYLAELVAVAMLSAALRRDPAAWRALATLPETVAAALCCEAEIARAARRCRRWQRVVVLARGFEFATAHELALKLEEMAGLPAHPYSTADFRHGPISVVAPSSAVIAIAPAGRALRQTRALLHQLETRRRAELVVFSDRPSELRRAALGLPLPAARHEWLSPMVSIVAGQLFAYHLALARGLDPERPRGLRKVTRTR